MRNCLIERKTLETDISLELELDGSGKADVKSGVGFLDHMLCLFAAHGGFDLKLRCSGDTWVDDHHSVEDVAIALGQAFARALGDKRGIGRYGDIILPMDEALVLCAVDISGRPCLRFRAELPGERVGSFDTELVKEFFQAFANNALLSLHIRMLDGENTHHVIEGMFKAFGRSLKKAVAIDPERADFLPSTKGVL